MLSVSSVNLVKQHPTFKGGSVTVPSEDKEYYSKDSYESDKSKLEQQLDDMNELIENTDVPKPVRTFGKIVSIGIGTALGFVSMKFGAQGVAKVMHKFVDSAKSFVNKPINTEIITKIKKGRDSIKTMVLDKGEKFVERFKATKVGVKLTEYMNIVKDTKFVNNLNEVSKRVKDSSIGIAIKDAKDKLTSVTAEKAEKGVINLFAVSGGVTGGITALQDATKGAE